MSGLAEAAVGVAVVHGDQVHIAEDEAVVVVLLQGLHVADVQQLGPIEDLVSVLGGGAKVGGGGTRLAVSLSQPWGGGYLHASQLRWWRLEGLVQAEPQSRRHGGEGEEEGEEEEEEEEGKEKEKEQEEQEDKEEVETVITGAIAAIG